METEPVSQEPSKEPHSHFLPNRAQGKSVAETILTNPLSLSDGGLKELHEREAQRQAKLLAAPESEQLAPLSEDYTPLI